MKINQRVMGYAQGQGLEKGQKVRLDSTGVESNFHYPDRSTLLRDAMRVITRLLTEGFNWFRNQATVFRIITEW